MRNQFIPTTAAAVPFTPLSILESLNADAETFTNADAEERDRGKIPYFLVKPLTEAELDQMGYELFRHNLVPPSQDTYRALLIDEIFAAFGDEVGEEKANLMDSYWQSEDVYQTQLNEWHEQDRQRRLDEQAGAETRKPLPLPQRMMGTRDRNRALLLAEDIRTKSQSLRNLTVQMQSYEPIQRAGLTRLVLLGWTGFDVEYQSVDGIVPQEVYAALRAEIQRTYGCGKAAIAELEKFVSSMGTLSETERGNLESPPPTEPTEPPSPEPNGAGSDGDSTSAAESTLSSSSSGAAPDSESAPITGVSSTFISGSAGDTASINDTPAEA